MVDINVNNNEVVFEVKGLHKLWAFRNKIKVQRQNILNVYQDANQITFWKGFRAPGTEVPGIITAGTFYQNGRNFWDVANRKNTIIVELQNESFRKLFIDVKNPLRAIQLLKQQ